MLSALGALLLSSCGPEQAKDEGVKLVFSPEKGKEVKMTYEFTVISTAKLDKTHFLMEMQGSAEKIDASQVVLVLENQKITVDGSVEGKNISYDANSPDSIPDEIKAVITPVFSLLNKKFKSVYDERMNKLSESIVRSDSATRDSAENKLQFFVRYPDTTIAEGYTWKRELVIKSGNKMNCSAIYTVKEIKEGQAVIAIEGDLTGEGETFGHVFSITGTLKGTIRVDLRTGWPVDTDIQQDFTLDLNGNKIPMQYLIRHTVAI